MDMPFSSLRLHHLRDNYAHPFDRANNPLPITSPFLPSGRVPPAAAYTTSMPNAPRVTCRTIPVEPGQLPAPATKLVITQVLQAGQDSQFWALITVGAFYDSQDRIIWSTEQFAARAGTESESDDEEASEAEAETGRESEAEPEAEAEAEATLESAATESTIEPSSPPGTLITVGLWSLSRPHRSLCKLTNACVKFILWQFISLYHPDFELATLNHTGNTPSAHIEAIITTNRPSLPLGPHIHYLAAPSFPAPSSPIGSPPAGWNPVFSGPVPGHWQASFQPSIGRWVHTWQPRPFEIPFR
ncbi:hypothetical protein THARTR1_00272 [Trichoderma harzianum]|uniref:Uncharacterized protein n=1 Tax=Trichoderma harzianum TaxID=5544 RepID=A0A2K0UR46_TRIHA|nr:hypothetical protein THARTR1_00272 [Trichoderma harzianum]